MVNWTILSAAEVSPEKETKKMTAKNIDNVFFIIHLFIIIIPFLFYMITPRPTNMQLQFIIDR